MSTNANMESIVLISAILVYLQTKTDPSLPNNTTLSGLHALSSNTTLHINTVKMYYTQTYM